jgi:hypothetical protein
MSYLYIHTHTLFNTLCRDTHIRIYISISSLYIYMYEEHKNTICNRQHASILDRNGNSRRSGTNRKERCIRNLLSMRRVVTCAKTVAASHRIARCRCSKSVSLGEEGCPYRPNKYLHGLAKVRKGRHRNVRVVQVTTRGLLLRSVP